MCTCQVYSSSLETKVKALVTKEGRFKKDLETKDKRIELILSRVKKLEQEKTAAVREMMISRQRLSVVRTERDNLLSINERLSAEKESLMMDVAV